MKLTPCLTALTILLSSSTWVSAQSATWNGSNSGSWSNAANWTGTAPTGSNTSSLDFTGTVNTTTTDDISGATTLSGVTFDASAGAFTLNAVNNSGTNYYLALNNTSTGTVVIANNNSNTQTINENYYAVGVVDFNVASGGITLTGNSGNAGNVPNSTATYIKDGAGILTLAGNNGQSGQGLTVNNGKVLVTSQNYFQFWSGNNVETINTGGSLVLSGAITSHIHNVVLNGGTLGSTGGTPNPQYGSWTLDNNTLTVTGTGTSTMSAIGVTSSNIPNGGFNGGVNNNSGTLTLNIASGATLNSTGSYGYGQATDLSLLVTGGGAAILAGSSSYVGTTTVNGGSTLSTSNLTNGGTHAQASGTSGSNAITVNTAGLGLYVGEAVEGAYSGNVGYQATVTSFTGTTVTLSVPNNGTFGNHTIQFGTPSGIGLATNAAYNLVIDGGTFQYTGAAVSTDRLFQVGSSTAGSASTVDASGTGALNFTNTSALTYGTTNQTRTLVLTGTNTGANILNPSIGNNGSSAVSLTKQGVGTWVLGGSNTYSGGTTIAGGTLQLGSATALGSISGNLTDNAILDLNGNSATVGALSGSASGLITSSSSGNLTLTTGGSGSSSYLGVIQDGAATHLALNVSGTGTLIIGHLDGTGITTNTYSGGTTINGGKLQVGDAANNSGVTYTNRALGTGAVNVTNGTLAFASQNGGSAAQVTIANAITLNGSSQLLSVDGINVLTGGLGINGTGNIVSSEYRYVKETGALTGSGSATIQYTNPGGYQGTSLVEFAGDGTGYTGTLTLNNSADLNPGSTTYGEQLGIGAANALPNASVVFTGASHNGTALVFDGVTSGTIGSISSTNSGDGQFKLDNTSGNAVALTVGGNNASTTYSGVISDSGNGGSLTKTGSGTLTLAGVNTYIGGTTISGGTLAAGVNNAIAPSSAVTVAGGTWAVGSFNDTVNDVTLNDGSITGTTGVITSTTGYDLFNGTVSAVLADANPSNYLIKDVGGVGANTVTLSGVNTYADTVVVADGTLAFTNGNTSSTGNQALGTNSTLYLGFSGFYATPVTLQYTGSGAATLAKDISAQSTTTNTIQNSGTGQLTLSGNVDKSDTNLILSGGSNGILVTGNITSANAQNSFDSDIYITSGTTTLDNSNNTYDGATHIYGNGVLVNGLSNALPSATVVELGNSDSTASEAGASFTNVYNLNGYNQTVAGLTSTNPANFTDNNSVVGGTGNGANSLSTLTVTPSGTDTYSGLIGGSGSNQNNVALVMSGTGTLALTGNNTYTGGTTVSSGFLNVTGSIANSAVSIASGATLSGTGTTGAVTNNAGGKIGLQDGSIGTLTVGGLTTGALNGTTTSAFTFDIGSTLGSNDKINDSGTLTLLGIGGTNGTTITIGNATGTTSLASGLYNLISYTGTYTGSLSNLNLLTTTLDGAYLSLVQGSGVIQLQVSSTAPSAGPAFFNGTTSDLNTASNYDTSVSSGTSISSAPGSSTNVSFSANRNSNTTGNVSAPLTVNSLAFGVGSGTNQETITSSGSGSITIQASAANGNTSGNGITVNSGTDSISAPVVLGASQSWTTSATSSLTVSGQVSGTGFALTKAGTGSLILSNPTGNTYTGGTTVSGGKLYVNNTSNSGTGSGAVTVNGGTLAGKGIIATSAGVVINGGGSLASGLAQSTTSKAVDGTHLAFNNTPVTVGSSTGTANLTFALGSGTSGIKGGTASGQYDFSNPNNNTTYLSLIGSSSINFAGTTSISLVDLTNTTGSNGSLSLRLSSPYLLITAGSNADYLNLVINSGTTANPIYSLSQSDANVNGWVVGVYTGGAVNGTDVSAINISQFGADGVTPLTPGANGTYPAPALYLDAGNLEVVPEPGTWALMLGGLALLVVIQRRRNKIS